MKQIRTICLLIILTTLILSCTGQDSKNTNTTIDKKQNDTDTVFTLLTYGLPDMEKQNAENVIAKKWGIRFHAVAGCMVTKELPDSVKTNNNNVNKLIEKKYGINWRERFEKEVDAEFEKEKMITTILDKIDFIKKKNEQMNSEGNGPQYYMTPIENSEDYNISVEGWGKIDNEDAWVSYYQMKVNYKTKKYELIGNKVKPRK